jgi:ribosomal-protein-alanine N-acetyltransferase
LKWLIRDAGGIDLDRLAVLVESCFGDGWGRSVLEQTLSDRATRVRIASDASRHGALGPALGFLVGRRVADFVEIDLLGVAAEARRKGCARALIDELVVSERAEGAREFRLELRDSNDSARSLYEAQGFVVVGRRSRYYPDGEDALLLTRRLSSPRTHSPDSAGSQEES